MPRNPLRSRRLVSTVLVAAVAVAVLTIAGLGFAGTADGGQSRCGIEYRYYSDASHTTQVGATSWSPESCGCVYSHWGQTTIYRQGASFGCW